jgi:hypothetical protein
MREPLLSIFVIMLSVGVATTAVATEPEVRFYEQDGVTYRETRGLVRRPVSETRIEQREETVYRARYSTQSRETTQTVYTPVTRFYWEARWHGWWNPFQDPYLAYHAVPYTAWHARQQAVRVPLTQRDLVPEKRTVGVPVTRLRFVEKEAVSRVAVRPRTTRIASTPPAAPQAGAGVMGGITRLEGDPPRYGTATNAGTWQARR